MALRKKAKAEAKDTTTEAPSVEKEVPSVEKEVVAKAEPKAVVAAGKGNAGVFIKNPALQELVLDSEYGDFPVITASNGNHMMKAGSNKINLGSVLEFQAIAGKSTWKVSTGDDSEEAKDFFKVSYDGEICTDGTPLADALQDAVEAGYSKSKISEGTDVYVLIRKCEADPDQEGEIRVLQLAPSSKRNWNPLEKKVKGKAALGMLKSEPIHEGSEWEAVKFESTATPTSYKGKDYTMFEFDLA